MQGTWQFMSAVLLAFPGHFQHAVWHDLESFIHVLHWMCLRFHMTDYSTARDLCNHVRMLYTDAYRGVDGVSYGGDMKLRTLLAGRIPFQLQNGSVGQPRGLHSLLVALSKLYGEHYAWLQATSQLPVKVEAEVCPRPPENITQDAEEELGPSASEHARSAILSMENITVEPPPPPKDPEPVLDYEHVGKAFEWVLIGPGDWIDDPKSSDDHFALFSTLNAQPAVTKRRSNGSSEQREKRSRQASQSNAGGTIGSPAGPLHCIGE